MATLVRFSAGRILLHVLAMVLDRSIRFHLAGMRRELPAIPSARALLDRARGRLTPSGAPS